MQAFNFATTDGAALVAIDNEGFPRGCVQIRYASIFLSSFISVKTDEKEIGGAAHVCDVLRGTPYSYSYFKLLQANNVPAANQFERITGRAEIL